MKEVEEETRTESESFLRAGDFYWPGVGVGFLISAVPTLAIGGPLIVVLDSSWLLALVSIASLFAGAFTAARMAGTSEPLNGALIVLLHFFVFVLIFFIGQITGDLPEPLPGLDQSDSLFFFSWPLLGMLSGTLGSIIGGLGRKGER